MALTDDNMVMQVAPVNGGGNGFGFGDGNGWWILLLFILLGNGAWGMGGFGGGFDGGLYGIAEERQRHWSRPCHTAKRHAPYQASGHEHLWLSANTCIADHRLGNHCGQHQRTAGQPVQGKNLQHEPDA